MSLKQLRQLQRVSQRSLSLNHYVGDEDNTEVLDLLEDTDSPSPDSQVSEDMMCQGVRQVLDEALTQRESEILALRYGLDGEKRKTLQEISTLFNLSRERVRQIQTTAMRKLRRPQISAACGAGYSNLPTPCYTPTNLSLPLGQVGYLS